MTDLDQMRAAIAGMTPLEFVVVGDDDDEGRHYSYIQGPTRRGSAKEAFAAAKKDELSVLALQQAHEVRVLRKWWTELDDEGRWVVWYRLDECTTSVLLNEKGRSFHGPDPETPLVEANEYFVERGR